MDQFIQMIIDGIKWFFSTELPKDTADCIGRIITNSAQELIPLMWKYIDILTGQG